MLVDDPEVAVNEVIVACQKAADHYQHGADLVEDASLKQLFASLGSQRRAASEKLSDIIRDRGSLPREVDIEQEQLQMLWSHLKAVFSHADNETLLNEMIDHEALVKSATETALDLEPEEVISRVVQHIQDESSMALRQLRAAMQQ